MAWKLTNICFANRKHIGGTCQSTLADSRYIMSLAAVVTSHLAHGSWSHFEHTLIFLSGAPNGTVESKLSILQTLSAVWQNLQKRSWIYIYKCSISLYIFKILFNKYFAISIIMHSASQIRRKLNMSQLQIVSLVPHPQIGPFYEEIWPAGWQVQYR